MSTGMLLGVMIMDYDRMTMALVHTHESAKCKCFVRRKHARPLLLPAVREVREAAAAQR